MSGLRRNAIKLAAASALEFGLQFAIPVILVRTLSETVFAQYRLLWLMASTMLALMPLFMPQALFYFLPRADTPLQRARVIGNTLAYLLTMALLLGLVLNPWNPLLQPVVHDLLAQSYGAATGFLMLWLVLAMFDTLPVAESRASWQANCTIGLALLRTALLALAAWYMQSLLWVVLALVVQALSKLGLLLWYILRRAASSDNSPRLGFDAGLLRQQLRYALPFAIGNGLYSMRSQADQWVVATLLSPKLYGSFSIATSLQPIATLLRLPVYNAMMPRLNAACAKQDYEQVRHLITKSNAATAMMLIPVAGMFFVCAPQLIELVYTTRHLAAIDVMRVYLLGMIVNAFAVGHVLPALDLGKFATRNNGVCLLLSVLFSWLGVKYFGLAGAACGSVATLAMSELWSAHVVARKLSISVAQLLSWRTLWPTLLATSLALGVCLWLGCSWPWPLLYVLLAKGSLFVAVWLGSFLAMGGKRQILGLRDFN
jgi:O-antigen/teichoic acid export membrane protein